MLQGKCKYCKADGINGRHRESPAPIWDELIYPAGPHVGESLDLAFVICGDSSVTSVEDGLGRGPKAYTLGQNYPNPFNPATVIQFELPEMADVFFAVYNVKGERIRVLMNERKPAGRHSTTWDGRNDSGDVVASGIYFCRMQAGRFIQTRKLVFLK